MSRIRRDEPLNDLGMRVVGFMGKQGETLNDVNDRFNTFLKLEDPATGETAFGDPLARTGVTDLTMAEVTAVGFTTLEYQSMLRYELESPPGDFIASELELNALLAGLPPTNVAGIRLGYQAAPEGSLRRDQFREGPNHRSRGADQNWQYHALGWVDEKAIRVRHVPDRFKARYLYDGYFGGQQIMEPLSEKGMMAMDLTSMVALGFSADEYRAMYAYEEGSGNFVQSEDHLDEIMGFSVERGLSPPQR